MIPGTLPPKPPPTNPSYRIRRRTDTLVGEKILKRLYNQKSFATNSKADVETNVFHTAHQGGDPEGGPRDGEMGGPHGVPCATARWQSAVVTFLAAFDGLY